jgi:hypothetical protein
MSGSRRQLLVAVPIATLLTVALTWPLAARLGSAGRVDSSDARHGIWNVAWVARALTSDPGSLFDANIFYPHDNALAFSEANMVAGVLAIPAWLVTHNGLAAANSAILLSFILAAITMFALVRHLTGHVTASAIAALFFAFSPYAFSRLGHMQLLMTFGLPLTLLCLHRFVQAPGAARALALGSALAVRALSCGYYGIFMGLTVGWGLLWFAVGLGHWRRPRFWLWSLAALAIAAQITAPFLIPYERIRAEGFARTLDEARLFSADWRSYLASPKLVHEWMLPLLGSWRKVLFPGALVVGFAVVTLVQGYRGSAWYAGSPGRRGIVAFYASLALLAAWASFGPDAGLYALFFRVLPFFELIRAPGRFGVLVTLALSVLAGFSIAVLLDSLPGRKRRAMRVILVIATLLTSTVGPLPLTERLPFHPVYRRLAQMPRGAVVEFPYFVEPTERHRHTEYMFESIRHWQPLVNGYSDHMPASAYADAVSLAGFPREEAWAALRRRGARYVVMHWHSYPSGSPIRRQILETEVGSRLRVVTDHGDLSLFEVMPATSLAR